MSASLDKERGSPACIQCILGHLLDTSPYRQRLEGITTGMPGIGAAGRQTPTSTPGHPPPPGLTRDQGSLLFTELDRINTSSSRGMVHLLHLVHLDHETKQARKHDRSLASWTEPSSPGGCPHNFAGVPRSATSSYEGDRSSP